MKKNNYVIVLFFALFVSIFSSQISLAQTQLLFPGIGGKNKVAANDKKDGESVPSVLFPTPRSAAAYFLESMQEVQTGSRSSYEKALTTLELSFIDRAMRSSVGRVTADRLILTLKKLGGLNLSAIPTYTDGARWYFRKQTVDIGNKIFDVEISIDKDGSGNWRFTKETILSIENFEESLADVFGDDNVTTSWRQKIKKSMPEWTSHTFFIMKNGQWLAIIFLIATGLLFFVFARFILSRYLRRKWNLDHIEQTLEEENDSTLPFGILAFALTWVSGLRLLELHLDVFSYLMRAGLIMTAISTVWVGLKIVDLLGMHFEKVAEESLNKFDDVLVPMLKKTAKVVVVAVGAVFVAHSLTFDIGSILAGLGIGGVAVALAAKDTISNLFGSITVLLDRPFQIGDYIMMEKGIEGTVEEVGFRSTRIRTPYNSLISLPNQILANVHVDNYGARKMRRFRAILQVDQGTDVKKLEEFCDRLVYLIKLNPMIKQDNFQVAVHELTPQSVNVLLNVFFETTDTKVEIEEKHKFILEILSMAKEINITLASSTQTMLLKVPGTI